MIDEKAESMYSSAFFISRCVSLLIVILHNSTLSTANQK